MLQHQGLDELVVDRVDLVRHLRILARGVECQQSEGVLQVVAEEGARLLGVGVDVGQLAAQEIVEGVAACPLDRPGFGPVTVRREQDDALDVVRFDEAEDFLALLGEA